MSEVIFLLKYWKYLVSLLVLGAMFYMGAHWQGGRDATKAAVIAAAQAQRDAAAATAFELEVKKVQAAEQAATEANRRIYADLEPKLAAATASSNDFARRLRDAIAAESDSGPVPQGTGHVVPIDSSRESGSAGAVAGPIERATADYDAACQRDALRFSALQAEVQAQL